jgi:hypothetical protein
MVEKIFFYLIILVFVIAICFYVYWRITKRSYTRERFAFISSANSLSLISLMIPVIFGNNDLLNVGIDIFNQITNKNIKQIQDLQFSARMLGAGIILAYLYFSYKIYTNWSGHVSIRQHNQELEKDDYSFLGDLIANFNAKERKFLRVFIPSEEQIKFDIEFPKEENLPWHIKAAQLLILSSIQYKIDLKSDWHKSENCFISSYSNDRALKVAIYCSLDTPSIPKLRDFISFAKKITGNSIFKYHLLIKNEFKSAEALKQIGEPIDIKTEKDLLDELIDFKDYENYIINAFETDEIIDGYKYSLNDIYTIPSCTVRNRKNNGQYDEAVIVNIETYINDWINNFQEKKQIALLGEYGQGKSVLAQRICYLIFKRVIKTDRIPIIIELRGKYPKQYSDLVSFIADWSSKYRLDPHAILRLHISGRLLIIFDAFDEMELVGDYAIRLEHFRKIWSFNYPNSKIIITGRPNYFLNDNELKTILKTAETHTEFPHCEEIYINMFDADRIAVALRSAEQETRNDIMSILSNPSSNASFIDLISRPALLFLTSIVWKERNLNQFKDNINSAKVIEEFLKQTYQRQNKKPFDAPLSGEERAYFMLGIAVKMVAKNGYTNQISQDELKQIITKLSENFPNELTDLDTSTSGTKTKLDKRFDKKYSQDTIFNDIRSCGIIVRDLSTVDNFKYAHKSFLEYLTSFYYANILIDFKGNQTEKIMIRSIKLTFGLELDNIKRTAEVFRFICQIIAQRININSEMSDYQKMNSAFRILHPYKKIGFKTAAKLIPICGRDLTKTGFHVIVWLIMAFLTCVLLIIVNGWKRFFSDEILYNKTALFILVGTLLYFYFMPIYLDNYMHRSNSMKNKKNEESLSDKFFTAVFRSIGATSLTEREKVFRVLDAGNFNLWYQVCLEIGIHKDVIRKNISKKLFEELDSNYREIIKK